MSSLPEAMRWIIAGNDDYVNPKKRLERQYIFSILTATQCRQLRYQQQQKEQQQQGPTAPVPPIEDVHDQAIEDLDARDVDSMTNEDLRRTLQAALEPQVQQIFQTFDKVDQKLAIPIPTASAEQLFSNIDWEPYMEILKSEREYVEKLINHLMNDLSNLKSRNDNNEDTDIAISVAERQMAFLQQKRRAVELLWDFHIQQGNITTSVVHDPFATKDNDYDDDRMDAFGTKEVSGDNLLRNRYYQTLNLCRSSRIRDEIGYSILTLKSTIPGAGRGAFLDGTALLGSLVAFQPGEVWPKEHLLTDDPDVMDHFDGEEDCQTSLRFDDYLVDSRNSPVSVLTILGSLNPWAIGHMVNHPPKGRLPNCQSAMLDFTNKMKLERLMRYIPNFYARTPGWMSTTLMPEPTIVQGLSLVARRDVVNEELLYDYRLQSDTTPEWYSAVRFGYDMDDEQVVFFRDDWMGKDK